MAKGKLTETEVRNLLIGLNPKRLGPDANPIVPQLNSFIFTGKTTTVKDKEVKQWVFLSTQTEEAKKANPGLAAGRYFRLLKTEATEDITNSKMALDPGRKPLADNMFENQNPVFFGKILQLFREKDEKGNYLYFTPLADDRDGNPVMQLKNPVKGAFVTLNMPAHYRIRPDGKILSGARKNIVTQAFEKPEKIVFRSMVIFLTPAEFENLEAIAINRFQKLVEPLLAEEIVIETKIAGKTIETEVKHDVVTEGEEEEDTASDVKSNELVLGDDGLPM